MSATETTIPGSGSGSPSSRSALVALMLLNGTVFVSSFCMMVIELTAGRIIARTLGASLYTWTSVIGVVLAGIAVGNYAGGLIADRRGTRRTLALLFVLSSALSASIVLSDSWVGGWSGLWMLSWPARVASHVALVFFLPAAMLGTISPVVAKMALEVGRETGRTLGSVYAWATVGSIVGTFATGFWLVDLFGTRAIIWAVAGVLALMGLGYGLRSASTWGWAGILLIGTILGTARWSWASQAGEKLGLRDAADPSLIYSDESQYSLIRIYRMSPEGDVRAFLLDTLLHSQIDMQDPANFQYGYEKVYASATKRLFKGRDRVDNLTIGGGGYVYPRYMEATWPAGRTEVAEIDPAVTEAARAAFGMPRDSKIICHDEDGRVMIDRMAKRQAAGEDVPLFDVIYCDAVNDYSVPFQLTSVEFVRNIHAALRPGGAYLMNMIDIYNTGGLLGSMVSTIGEVFEHVYVFVEGSSLAAEGAERDTFVILGVDEPFDATDLGKEYRADCRLYCLSEAELTSLTGRTGGFVLTDDYAPVENLLAPVVKDQSRLRAAGDFEVRAERLIQKNDFVGAIKVLEPAIARLSDQPRLRNKYGYCLYRTDRYEEAAIQFRLAIVAQPRYVDAYYNLGNAMFKQRKAVEAAEAYAEAVRLRPTHADAFFNLGNSLAALGRLKEAAACYERTLQLKPNDADAQHHLDVVTQKIPATSPAS